MSDNQDLSVEESNKQELNNQEIDQAKLSENYAELEKIGAQKIHEQTHIPKIQCEDLVSGYFESMNKIQFTGFVSILEREYSLDLSALKAEGLKSFKGKTEFVDIADSKVFITPKKSKSYTLYYIIAAILIFLFVFFGLSSEDEKTEPKIDNKKIEQVASKIAPKPVLEENIEVEEVVEEEKKELTPIKIIPNVKLWVGYINLNTGRKLQKIVPQYEALELDPEGHWLLSLGHGDVSFEFAGELKEFKEAKNIRLLYKDGELKKISYREFLALNKGKEW